MNKKSSVLNMGKLNDFKNKNKEKKIPDYVWEANGLPVPEKQYKFHSVRKWRIDYAWPHEKVAVEIDGGIWIYGSHSRGSGLKRNYEKRNAMAEMGWVLLCYEPSKVDFEQVKRALEIVKIKGE